MTNAEMSIQTRTKIAHALKKFMRKKPFSKITVSEIIRECNINRKTFYYHFTDINALLKWILEEEAFQVIQHFDVLLDYKEVIAFVVDYVNHNDYLISCAYDSIGRDEMKRFFCSDFYAIVQSVFDRVETEKQTTLEPDFKTFLVRFYTEALAGTLIDIVREPDWKKREKKMNYLTRVIEKEIEHLTNTL